MKHDNNYCDAFVNKGLLCLESDDYRDFNLAKEYFEKALDRYVKDNREKYHSRTDIWNDLGIANYYLQNYQKAKEYFEKALKIDKDYNLAEKNKIITIDKINNKNNDEKTILEK